MAVIAVKATQCGGADSGKSEGLVPGTPAAGEQLYCNVL
jgi:hypothetical protein